MKKRFLSILSASYYSNFNNLKKHLHKTNSLCSFKYRAKMFFQSIIMKIASVSIVCLLLTSCGNTTSIQNKASIYKNESRGSINIVNGRTKNYNNNFSNPKQKDELDVFESQNIKAESRAEKIATSVRKIASIKDAYVVVTGTTAIVGINIMGEYNDSRLIEIKHQVEKDVKSTDEGINHVAVTAAPDLVERINKMMGIEQTEEEEKELEKLKENDALFRVAPTI